jgi:hypothetical protein
MIKIISAIMLTTMIQACTIKINCKEIENMNFDAYEDDTQQAVKFIPEA